MKIKHLLLFGWAAALVGCTDYTDELPGNNTLHDGLKIQISGNIHQQYLSRVDDGGFCGGDQVGLYGVNYTNNNTEAGTLQDKDNQVDNIRYTYDEENMKWTSSSPAYYKDVNTCIDLYAYYPYAAPGSVSEYEFEVAKDQNNNGGYAASDFLWAKAEKVQPSENKVSLRFSHMLSCANVILKAGNNFAEGEFESLKKSVLVLNTTHTSEIDLSTGEATPVGDPSKEGILMMEGADGFRAVVVPQTVAAGQKLFAITVNGITYHFSKDIDFTYAPGMQSKFTLTINKKEMTGEYEFILTDTEIVQWVADLDAHGGEARQYYVVHQEKPGTLGALIRADKKNPDKIKNLKISGKINANDFYFMRDSMEILQAINLKETKIESFSTVRFQCFDEESESYQSRVEYFDRTVTRNEAEALLREKYPNLNYVDIGELDNWNANEIPSGAFQDKNSLVYFSFPEKVTKVCVAAFERTLLSGALIIPDDVTVIEGRAFSSTNITSLTFPNQLKEIGNEAFAGCQSLSDRLNLPESLVALGRSSFFNCSGLSGVLHIPHQIKRIETNTFYGCKGLTGLKLPEGLEFIGENAWGYCPSLSGELILPQSLKTIENCAFQYCSFHGELIIPDQIKTIKSSTFYNNKYSSIIFPSELLKIESEAFYGNDRLCEPLIFPETLLSIGEGAFNYCQMLSKVIFPSKLATIQTSAFAYCYSLSSITSYAKTPPAIQGSVFDGVAKDNFTVEVPEGSVIKYQTADGWSEFKHINAHHDFSISRSLLRTLNAEYSHTYTLRVPAGQVWSIQDKPEWVSVTPESGVGKTDVTIKVDEMAASENWFETNYRDEWNNMTSGSFIGRSGDIVFLLNEKNYTSTMKVEQYNYNRADGEVITHQTATKGDGVNIVFMGDCFDAFDIARDKYMQAMEEAIGYFFAVEPYKTYKEYFNVYTVVGMSPESGTGTVNTIREAKFCSQYSLSNGIVPNESLVYEYACKAPTVTPENIHKTLVVLIENTQSYGGLTFMWSDGSAIAVCPMSKDAYPYDFRGLVQHEAGGHGFGKLADEYIYTNGFIQSCGCLNPHVDSFNWGKSLGWYDNLSLSGNMNEVPWSHLIYHPTYSNIVDMYEGGYYHTRGVYRSEATSCMNNNIPYFSAISRESIVKRIMDYANEPFLQEEFYAKDVLDAGSRAVQDPWTSSEYTNYVGSSKQYAPKLIKGKPMLK